MCMQLLVFQKFCHQIVAAGEKFQVVHGVDGAVGTDDSGDVRFEQTRR